MIFCGVEFIQCFAKILVSYMGISWFYMYRCTYLCNQQIFGLLISNTCCIDMFKHWTLYKLNSEKQFPLEEWEKFKVCLESSSVICHCFAIVKDVGIKL